MKKYTLILLLFISSIAVHAQSVKISGEVTAPLTINASNLQKFTQTEVKRKDRDGKDHIYSGVVLADILTKAGVTLGKSLMGENLAKYVLVSASDGYQVVFALPELDKDFTDRTIILANKVDGQLLAAGDGPFRIIVQDEKKPARCIKQVTEIKVLFAK